VTAEAKRLMQELARRERFKPDPSKLPDLLHDCFPEQRAFIEDKSKRKVALCSRRAGKSVAIGKMIVREALANPGCNIHYVSLTRESARKIMFKDVMKRIDAEHALGCRFKQHPLSIEFLNGSVCYFVGADSNEKERDKLRGGHNKLVVIDEAQSFNVDLKDLIDSTLGMSLVDEEGQVVVAGTPGLHLQSFFYKISAGGDPEWSVHKWTTDKNTFMAPQFEREIARKLKANPKFKETPEYLREYEGKWVVDREDKVYVHGDHNLDVEVLPPGERFYMLGVDVGYNDAFACVLVCYVPHDNRLYVVDAYQQTKLLTHQQVQVIKDFRQSYPITRVVIDGANKQVVEDMKQRFGLHLETAVKHGKAEYVAMLNSDLAMGTIKLLPSAAQKLVPEWENLTWDRKQLELGKRVESKRANNHLSDALLYVWRSSKNWAARPFQPKRRLTVDEQAKLDRDRMFQQQRREASGDIMQIDSLL
jgi:PBSX family phage terminase large subunit